MEFKIEDVTPKMAEEYLVKNTCNRSPRPKKIATLVAEMKNGDWLLNHQPIAFNTEEELIDGQHRLYAIVKSGVACPLVVARGVPKVQNGTPTMDVVDRGSARSVADHLKIQHGIKNAGPFLTIANAIGNGFVNADSSLTVSQALKFAELWPRVFEIADVHKKIHPALNVSVLKAAAALAFHSHPDAAAEFWDGFVTGKNLSEGHPAFTFREHATQKALRGERMVSGKQSARRELFRSGLEAIRAIAEGEEMHAVFPGEVVDCPVLMKGKGKSDKRLMKLYAGHSYFITSQEKAFRAARRILGFQK